MEIQHRYQLPELLRHFNLPLIGAEVGVAEGYFSADLLHNGMEELYMIDLWSHVDKFGDSASPQAWHDKNFEAAVERVKPYGDKAVILKGWTTEMAAQIPDNSLGLVYLDAGHDFNSVKADLMAYFPKLVPGGIMAGHDYLNDGYGVRKAVTEFCEGKYEIHLIPENNEHPEYASFWFKI